MKNLFKISSLLLVAVLFAGCGTYFDLQKYKGEIDISKPRYSISTVYYIPVYSEESSKRNCQPQDLKNVKEVSGKVLARLCPAEIGNCALQGSCYYSNLGSVILLAHHKVNPDMKSIDDGSYFFKISSRNQTCPQGVGIKNICLDPYHSIAADPAYYAAGDVIFVPDIVGTVLPDGSIHDGFFTVRDSGHAIKGIDRFDFFIGFDRPNSNHIFYKKGLSSKESRLIYYRAMPIKQAQVKAERQFPLALESVIRVAETYLEKTQSQ